MFRGFLRMLWPIEARWEKGRNRFGRLWSGEVKYSGGSCGYCSSHGDVEGGQKTFCEDVEWWSEMDSTSDTALDRKRA